MTRLIKVLAATALMVVLMATTVSPAFAVVPEQYGKEKEEGETGIGYGVKSQEQNVDYGCKAYDDPGYHAGKCPQGNKQN